MEPKIQAFLERIAKADGPRPESLRWANMEVLRRAMTMPAFADYLDESDRKAVLEAASTALPPEAGGESEATSGDAPEAPTKAPKAAKKTAKAAKTAAVGLESLEKAKPISITFDAEPIPMKSWRGVLLTLAERLLTLGREADFPATWIKDEKHRTVTALSNGKFLYMNLTNEQMLPRVARLGKILAESITLRVEVDGEEREVNLT